MFVSNPFRRAAFKRSLAAVAATSVGVLCMAGSHMLTSPARAVDGPVAEDLGVPLVATDELDSDEPTHDLFGVLDPAAFHADELLLDGQFPDGTDATPLLTADVGRGQFFGATPSYGGIIVTVTNLKPYEGGLAFYAVVQRKERYPSGRKGYAAVRRVERWRLGDDGSVTFLAASPSRIGVDRDMWNF